ncbi:MAG: hypothetical protein ACLQAH_07320 [Limisphaerales bacterium]
MAGVFLLVLIGALIWLLFFRKTGRRRRKYRLHHRHRSRPVTLAETGGLPPIRPEEKPPDPPPPTFEP